MTQVFVNVSVELTSPPTYKIPLMKLAVNAPRAAGRFALWLHLSEARS